MITKTGISTQGDSVEKKSVLILGIYLANQCNNAPDIIKKFNEPCEWNVVQKWAAIGMDEQPEEVKRVTVQKLEVGAPKFVLLNKMMNGEIPEQFDYVLICDDDISFPKSFLTSYLSLVKKHDLALAQPARTHNSYIDHHIVEQLDGLEARRTRFVEIGPLFSVRKDLYPVIFPFDESSYMGWGYDFVWPCIVEKIGLRMGIIDATPVEHSMRKPVKNYVHREADKSEAEFLSRNDHLARGEAFRILESYA
jgi:hypothetical protein